MPKVDPLTALADLARRWQVAGFGEVTFPHKPRHGFEALTTPDALYAALAEVERLRAALHSIEQAAAEAEGQGICPACGQSG